MTTGRESIVRVEGATRRYGQRVALDGVSLEVPAGQWVALLGPNGAGKSTLLRILATLDAPDSGGAWVLGADMVRTRRRDVAEARARLGVVFQRPGLDPLLSIRENMRTQCLLHLRSARQIGALIDKYAHACAVADRLDDRVGALSGGLARRADLARALLTEPDLLLLDEPTTGLDLAARRAFLDTLAETARGARAVSIVMNTHDMDEAERTDRVIMLDRGRIVADGAPGQLRTELGGTIVRTTAPGRGALESAGLDVTEIGDQVVGAGDVERARRAAEFLLDKNVGFEVGPPTLGDVYLARTGRSLAEEVGA